MFLGINTFLVLLRAHFKPSYARAKIILSRAKNIFMQANVNSIVIIIVLFTFMANNCPVIWDLDQITEHS